MRTTSCVLRTQVRAPAPKAEQTEQAGPTIQKSAVWYWFLILAVSGWSFGVEAAPRYYGSLPELVQDFGLFRAPDVSLLAPARAEMVLENFNANLGTNRIFYLPVTMRLRTDPKKHWDNGGYVFDTDEWSIAGIACGPDSTLLGFVRCSGRTAPLEYAQWWSNADGVFIPKSDAKSIKFVLDLRSGTRLSGEAPFKLYYADNGRTFRMLLAQDLGYSVRKLGSDGNEPGHSPREAVPKGKQVFLSHPQLQVWLQTNQWFLPTPPDYATNSYDIPKRARDVWRALSEFEAAASLCLGLSANFDSAFADFAYRLHRSLAALPSDARWEVDRVIRRDYSGSFDRLAAGMVLRLQRNKRVPPSVINDIIEFLENRPSKSVERVVYSKNMAILTRAADAMFDQLEGKPPAQSVIEGRRSWEEYHRKLASDQASIQVSNQPYSAQIEWKRLATPVLNALATWKEAPRQPWMMQRYYLGDGSVTLEVQQIKRASLSVETFGKKTFGGWSYHWDRQRGGPHNPDGVVIRAVLNEPKHEIWTTEFKLIGPALEVEKVIPQVEAFLGSLRFPAK